MCLSRLFFTTLRDDPSDAEMPSHRLLVRAGYIRQLGAGIYSLLPLGFRVAKRVEQVIREEMDRIGCQEMEMPVVHPAELWKETGRWYQIGPEMARFKDRGGRDMVLAMTHEEVVADLLRDWARDAGREVLWDGRDESPGVKFADAELLGMPLIIPISPRSLAAGGAGTVRATGRRTIEPLEAVEPRRRDRIQGVQSAKPPLVGYHSVRPRSRERAQSSTASVTWDGSSWLHVGRSGIRHWPRLRRVTARSTRSRSVVAPRGA